jgi:hypothetical protein
MVVTPPGISTKPMCNLAPQLKPMKIDGSHIVSLNLQLIHQKIIGPLIDPTG